MASRSPHPWGVVFASASARLMFSYHMKFDLVCSLFCETVNRNFNLKTGQCCLFLINSNPLLGMLGFHVGWIRSHKCCSCWQLFMKFKLKHTCIVSFWSCSSKMPLLWPFSVSFLIRYLLFRFVQKPPCPVCWVNCWMRQCSLFS